MFTGKRAGTSLGSLVLLDRTGTATPLAAAPRDYFGPRTSPDGTRIAVEVTEGTSTQIDIVTVDTGDAVRLTFEGTRNRYPVWTPDSQTVVFASNRGDGEGEGIYRKAADGSGHAEIVFEDERPLAPTDVSRDWVLAFVRQGEGSSDIWTLPLDEGSGPSVFLATPADEFDAQFSSDGRWMAYSSNDGAGVSVYARPYPPHRRRPAADLRRRGSVQMVPGRGDAVFLIRGFTASAPGGPDPDDASLRAWRRAGCGLCVANEEPPHRPSTVDSSL